MTEKTIELKMAEQQGLNDDVVRNQDDLPVQSNSDLHWVIGTWQTAAGPVFQVSSALSWKDYLGTVKSRFKIGRMNYLIQPALYCVGSPGHDSPVLITANYKLSFDCLRRELEGMDAWLLVIDTKGINVWCAAGKGSFGTEEVLRMIKATNLFKIISHRTLILPQLAAPGVSAHQVRRESGFKVIYGPVRAKDIKAFIKAGFRADASMRQTTFNLADRLILAPSELVSMVKPLLCLAAFILLLNIAAPNTSLPDRSAAAMIKITALDLTPFLFAFLIGIILVPTLLPYIPGRALAWKGWLLGFAWALLYALFIAAPLSWLQTASYLLVMPALSAYWGFNFTGSTTYTSLSGVIKEMNIALPLIITSGSLGLVAYILARFI